MKKSNGIENVESYQELSHLMKNQEGKLFRGTDGKVSVVYFSSAPYPKEGHLVNGNMKYVPFMGKGSTWYNIRTLGLAKELTMDEEQNKIIRENKAKVIGKNTGLLVTAIAAAYFAFSGYQSLTSQKDNVPKNNSNTTVVPAQVVDTSKTYFAPNTTIDTTLSKDSAIYKR
jgi:hypothetical protein